MLMVNLFITMAQCHVQWGPLLVKKRDTLMPHMLWGWKTTETLHPFRKQTTVINDLRMFGTELNLGTYCLRKNNYSLCEAELCVHICLMSLKRENTLCDLNETEVRVYDNLRSTSGMIRKTWVVKSFACIVMMHLRVVVLVWRRFQQCCSIFGALNLAWECHNNIT